MDLNPGRTPVAYQISRQHWVVVAVLINRNENKNEERAMNYSHQSNCQSDILSGPFEVSVPESKSASVHRRYLGHNELIVGFNASLCDANG